MVCLFNIFELFIPFCFTVMELYLRQKIYAIIVVEHDENTEIKNEFSLLCGFDFHPD